MQYYARIVKTMNGVKKIVGLRKIDRIDNTFCYFFTKYKLRTVEPSEEYDGKAFFYYDVTNNCQLTNSFTIDRIRTNMIMSDISSLSLNWFMLFVISMMLTFSIIGIMKGLINIGG